MDDKMLEDKAKSAQAIELINRFDLNADFSYLNTSLQHSKDHGRISISDRYKGLFD